MTCSQEKCKATAMRQGTKGRAYCFAHDSNAFDQMAKESGNRSAEVIFNSANQREEHSRERKFRAV